MAAKKKHINVDDLWALQRVGGLSLSPDGAQAVCSVSSFDMNDNTSSTSLWLLSTYGGDARRLTSAGDKDGQPAWSPRGDRIAFVAKREQQGKKDDTPQLYVVAPDGGEAQRISHFACGVEAFKWFPDGKRIAFISWVWPGAKGSKAQAKRHQEFKDRKETGYVTSEAQYRFWDHNLPMGRVAHLHVLDVASGKVRDLFEGTAFELPRTAPDANAFDISPDGKRIVFAFDTAAEKRLDNCKALVALEVRSGKTHTVAADAAWDFDAPRYSPSGEKIAFIASHQGLKHTMPGQLAVVGAVVGAVVNKVLDKGSDKAGSWAVQSADWDHSVNAPLRWASDGAAVMFSAEDQGRCNVYRFELATRSATSLVQGGWVQGFDVAADVLVSAADAMGHPTRVHARRANQASQRIEAFNDAALSHFKFGRSADVRLKGANGDTVQMWVTYPPGFDAKKKYPVINNIHGGPHAAAGDTFHFRWNNQVFAAQGYIVANVNYHGSSGFGYEFLDSITHRWGDLESQDVEAATDWLLKQAWVDKKRVFATGGSYGGYMVAWMNGHVPAGRYQAYVCHAGCFDWQAMFADDAYTWHAKELGAWYWEDAAKVNSQSPSSFVAAMQTPTLVIHGALDYRVPDGQGLAYYNTLKAKGVDARLLWFPDENHWILKPRNSRMWYQEYFAWLKRYDCGARTVKVKKD